MNKPRRIVLAAGGTGGHMFPAQALAEQLVLRKWQVFLSTDPRGARFSSNFPRETACRVLRSASPTRGGIFARLLAPLQIALSVLSAIFDYIKHRPACVVGFGGYPCFPAVTAAWILRIPRLLHEQNGYLGRVNRLFAARTNMLALGTELKHPPKGTRMTLVGNPLRKSALEFVGQNYAIPNSDTGILKLVITGGSQGAQILDAVIPATITALGQNWQKRLHITQQTRAENTDQIKRVYEKLGIRADVAPFFSNIPARMAAAHLIISRAGASSIAEITAIGRPAILVPFAAATHDHQSANARPLERAGAALVFSEPAFTAKSCAAAIVDILSDPKKARAMAKAALDQAKPNATETLTNLVETIANRA